ncbi:type II secretion system F family protein [candidate division KSB1 bacterium]|nr:type II secretion system F family protein [candidate division KSB1 bacterium]
MTAFILLGIFGATTFFVLAISMVLSRHISGGERQIKKRLGEIPPGNVRTEQVSSLLQDSQLSQIPTFNRILEKLKIPKKLSQLLEQTDLKLKVGQLILMMFVFGMLGVLLPLKKGNILLILLSFIMMSLLPLFYVDICRTKRLKLFTRGFPDAIDMMNSALKAGHALNKAMQLVSNEAPPPVSTEFRKTFEENSLGLPMKEALMNLTTRVNSTDLKLFVMAILLQRETGGNLTEILDKISYTIRERFKLMGQIKIYTAQGRLSMWIIGALPITFALLVSIINPEYLKPLFNERIGVIMLSSSIFMQMLGFLMIKKLIKIKFQ